MASKSLIPLLFLLICVFVKGENDCVVYSFDNDVSSLFGNEKLICTGFPAWSVGNYSEIGIIGLNANSDTFISPGTVLNCMSTFSFAMEAGGVVEVNVYMDPASVTDQITVLVNKDVADGNDAVVATGLVISSDPSFVTGWSTLKMTLIGTGAFEGYISFLGLASEESVILIDSFRYISSSSDIDSCVIYEVESDTTTEQESTTDDGVEDCVTYNFEEDFEIRFTTDNYLCDGFLPWHLDNYTDIDVASPNPRSTVFMAPNEFSSCISSFVFKMDPDGIVEANVYMEPVTALDHIIVLAQKVTDKEYDTVAGFKMYHPENQVFVSGWNVLRFTLLDFTSFEGYLIFIGSADKDSTVLVDSVRYIPPLTPPDDDSCILY